MEEDKKKRQEYMRDVRDSVKRVAICLISLLAFIYFCVANYNAIEHLNYKTVEWQSINKAQNNYNIFKNAFNAQKQAVINAYNRQVDAISQNGLKTEANFTGLQFDNNVFTDKINSNGQVLRYSHEATKAVDKLSETTVNTKIAKIKAFYDARVRNIYFTLKNGQKVVLSDLKEYGRQPNNVQLTEADFTPIATKIVDTRVVTTEVEPGKLPKSCNYTLLAVCMVMTVISAIFSGISTFFLIDDISYL